MANSTVWRKVGWLAVVGVMILGAAPLFGQGNLADNAFGQLFAFAQSTGERSYLGVGVGDIDAARAKEKNLSEERGAEITTVVSGSAAEKAGIEKGDVVLEYNRQPVVSVEQFTRLVRETPVGRTVSLQISRNGAIQTLGVTLGTRPGPRVFAGVGPGGGGIGGGIGSGILTPVLPDVPRVFTTWRSSMLGVEAEALEPQLAEFFGVKKGVLVRSVQEDSAAQKAGFRAGDVILEVAGVEVATPRDVTNQIRAHSGESFDVSIVRDRQQSKLTVTIEDDHSGERWPVQPTQRISSPPGSRF